VVNFLAMKRKQASDLSTWGNPYRGAPLRIVPRQVSDDAHLYFAKKAFSRSSTAVDPCAFHCSVPVIARVRCTWYRRGPIVWLHWSNHNRN